MKLYITIGIPGCGKTTWSNKFANNNTNVDRYSTDEYREKLLGDITCQDNNDIVFKAIKRDIRESLLSGKDVVYDATNYKAAYRKDIIKYVNDIANLEIVAVYFNTPLDIAKERNSKRERVVPECVIDRMNSRKSYPKLEEGFSEIIEVDQ